MDFLDPQKQREHTIRLLAGYVLIAVAVLITTLVLLYQAYGFGFAKDGQVIQYGLVFLASQPNGAQIMINDKRYKSNTNTKLQLPEGLYKTALMRDGYRDWKRVITVQGGSVQHFDYPKLFPTKLITSSVKNYEVAPSFASQSPDRRWIVVQQTASPLDFDVFDLADQKRVTTTILPLALPETIVSNAKAGRHTWKLVEWSTDNRHVLLQHEYQPVGAAAGQPPQTVTEYIMMDRQDGALSVNLTKTLLLPAGHELALHDKKYDRYYLYDTTAHTLATTSIADAGKVTPLLDHILAYKPYGADMILYMTDKGAPTGSVVSELYDNGQTYRLREHNPTGPYLLDMAQYSGNWYVAVGSSGDNKVSIYKDPQDIRRASQTASLVPVQILKLQAPNYLAFSSNTEFIMASNGISFADYDAEYDKGYTFTAKQAIDPAASHATWMDGDRLTYVSGSKLTVIDYDNINAQMLMPASADYLPFFNRDYSYAYTLTSASGATGLTLTATSLLTPADQ